MDTIYTVVQVSSDWYTDSNSTTTQVVLSSREAAVAATEALTGVIEVYATQVHDTFSEALPKAEEVLVYGGYTNLAGKYVRGWLDTKN